MKVTPNVIRAYVTWDTLPELEVGETATIPKDPIREETLEHAYKYSDAELRQLAADNLTLTSGAKLKASALTELPEGYLLESYLNLRYGIPIRAGIMPIRAGDSFSTAYATLTVYPVMAAVLAGIYNTVLRSVNPAVQAEAVQILRLQRHLCYSWLIAADRHRVNPTNKKNPIQSAQTVVSSTGEAIESETVVYLDYDAVQPLLALGWTTQSMAEFYVTNRTQPR